jgi:hypothetical protein
VARQATTAAAAAASQRTKCGAKDRDRKKTKTPDSRPPPPPPPPPRRPRARVALSEWDTQTVFRVGAADTGAGRSRRRNRLGADTSDTRHPDMRAATPAAGDRKGEGW